MGCRLGRVKTHCRRRPWTWTVALIAWLVARDVRAEPTAPDHLHVLMLNGGGSRQDNFASHLSHLRQMLDWARQVGVPREHIFVLASDGSDPAPDLAVALPEPDGMALLEGTRLANELRGAIEYQNSSLPGVTLQPATHAGLRRAIEQLRAQVKPGHTVVLLVTDHGTENRRDPLGNRISLWRESISVRELRSLLGKLPADVRVVTVMSQCFSGGFSALSDLHAHNGRPSGAACGYFSSTADRMAYGCYPEVRGSEAVGHAFEFFSALAGNGRLLQSHTNVVLSDQTPDVPLRTSDVYLADVIARAAHRRHMKEAQLADQLLRKAWQDNAFTNERALATRLVAAFGLDRPVAFTLGDLDDQEDELVDFAEQSASDARTWAAALGDLNQAHLDAFLRAHPAWQSRVEDQALRRLDERGRNQLARALVPELVAFVEQDAVRRERLDRLIQTLNTLDELSYRSEVRLAALLRLRVLLASVAGRVLLQERPASPDAQAAAALDRCEDLRVATPSGKNAQAHPPLPRLEADQLQASMLRPAWLGFAFAPVPASRRKQLALPEGAAQVSAVQAHSPAARAGLRRGDVLLSAAGKPLSVGQLRASVVLAAVGKPWAVEILRGSARVVLQPVPEAAPTH